MKAEKKLQYRKDIFLSAQVLSIILSAYMFVYEVRMYVRT